MTDKRGHHGQMIESGTTWRRVDFHLHTPGVNTFRCPNGLRPDQPGDRERIVRAYVHQLDAAGISLCAITDYNGVRREWFEPIRDQAVARGIVVLPGAELSINHGKRGLHILLVFGADTSPDKINVAIAALDKNPASPVLHDDGSHRDLDLRASLEEAVRELCRQFGCLVIPPHPDQDKGLCQSLQPKQAAQDLLAMRVDAIEHCPDQVRRSLQSTGVLPQAFFETTACVEFSDPKSVEAIGTRTGADGTPRATWLKLSSTELSAIRLALKDPATRMCIGTVPETRHARIERMEIDGSGFLDKTVIAWNPDLNVIIGGRGTGKSAIIETLRYALDVPPYSEAAYRKDLVGHALASGGKVTVFVRRAGTPADAPSYRIERVLGEAARVYDAATGKLLDIAPTDAFGPGAAPAIFGQREIYAVSTSEEYRLRLLDELIGEDALRRAEAVREAVEALRDNARAILDAGRKLGRRDEISQRLQSIQHEIELYEREGIGEKLRSATYLRADGQRLRAARTELAQVRRLWDSGASEALARLGRHADALRQGRSSERAILGEAATTIDALRQELSRLAAEGTTQINAAMSGLAALDQRWAKALEPLEAELNRLKQELSSDTLDPDRLLKLTEEKTAAEPVLKELDRLEAQRRKLLTTRQQVIDHLKQCRQQENALRRERAEAISDALKGRLRVRVVFKGQKDDYRDRLSSILKGSRLTDDAVKKLAAPEATDGLALAEGVRAGTAAVEERFGITTAMAQRLVNWLAADEARLFEIETLIPADAVEVELKVDDEFRPLARLSVGQRATAILLLLFALQGRGLILDQPEDDLDNRFVYEDIVTILREQKGLRPGQDRRQIIAATHNANIPVLGDAEQVLALEVQAGRRAAVRSRRSIDDPETCALIKRLMEGGDEAFRRRAEKYGEA